MSDKFIPFNRPSMSQRECDEVLDTINSLWLTTGPKTKKFEESFVELTTADRALALNSCTAGLHLGLKALGVGLGDEVITTPMTFCATANVIEHLGAITVLADVDRETWLISPEAIESKITDKTKVILPVHYAGQLADMDRINDIARNANLSVLEDAAHCLPNHYSDGTPVGGGPNLCAFSFYANKNITTGEGGMLTGPLEWVERCRSLSLHGMDRDAWKRFEKGASWKYDVCEPGFKYNMTDIQASLGLAQMERMMAFYESRKKISDNYREAFAGVDGLLMPELVQETSFHIFPIVVEPTAKLNRETFIEQMTGKGIGTSVHYLPVHFFTYYKEKYGWNRESYPVASFLGENCVTLPLYPELSSQDQTFIIESVLSILEGR